MNYERKCICILCQAGFHTPLLFVPKVKRFPEVELCTVLGALEQLYVVIWIMFTFISINVLKHVF